MSRLDAKFVALAIKLLNKYGTDASIVLKATGQFDPTTGTRATGSDSAPITKKIVPPSLSLMPNSDIRAKDSLQTYLTPADLPTDLKTFDTLIFNGVTYSITEATRIYSGDSVPLIRILLD